MGGDWLCSVALTPAGRISGPATGACVGWVAVPAPGTSKGWVANTVEVPGP